MVVKKITCTRCGRSIELKALPDEGYGGIGKVEVFEKAKGWTEHFNGHKDIDLCPECSAVCQSVWDAFISGTDLRTEQHSEGIAVPTPAGNITAKQTPDPEYPGIIVELESKNERPGVTMEYDSDEEDVIIRVWGKEDPDGDPVCVARIGGKED